MEAAPGRTSNGVDGDRDGVLGFNGEGSAQAKDKEGEEGEFEFGCVTRPDSPTKELGKSSPADHFFNGRLLPHAFKAATQPNVVGGGRHSSASSRDSFCSTLSSRSNSANSRSSTSSSSGSGGGSSGRTSSCDSSERRIWRQNKLAEVEPTTPPPQPVMTPKRGTNSNGKSAAVKAYAPAQQKWQFIAPLPVDGSRGKRNQKPAKKQQKEEKTVVEERAGLGRRVFRSFVAACRECHSMEPTPKGKLTELQLESS